MRYSAVGFILLGVLLLGGLFWAFKANQQSPPAVAAELNLEWALLGGKLSAGVESISVQQHGMVNIMLTSDTEDALHVHGYNKVLHLHTGITSRLHFVAEHAGRFEIELHNSAQTIAVMEVIPK